MPKLRARLHLLDRLPTDGIVVQIGSNIDQNNFPIKQEYIKFSVLLFTIVYCWWLSSSLLLTWFAQADDWVALEMLGHESRLPFGRIGQIIADSEIVPNKDSFRYRPLLDVLRPFEMWIWGRDLWGANLLRLLCFFTFVAVAPRLAYLSVGAIGTVTILLVIGNAGYWPNLLLLSHYVGEQFGLVGLGLLGLGIAHTWIRVITPQDRRPLDLGVIASSVGMAISIAAKETFIAVGVVFTAQCLLVLATGRYHWRSVVAACLVAAQTIWTIWVLSQGVVANGHDMYGDQVGIQFQFAAILGWPFWSLFWVTVGMIAAINIAIIAIAHRHDRGERCSSLYRSAVLSLGLTFVVGLAFVFQLVVYTGRIPSNTRYDFPALVAVPIALGLGIASLSSLSVAITGASRRLYIACWVLLAVILAPGVVWDFPLRSSAERMVGVSQQKRRDLADSANLAASHPDWPIYVVWQPPFGPEYAMSAAVWMVAAGATNPVELRMNPLDASYASMEIYRKSLQELVKVSATGTHGFRRAATLDPPDPHTRDCFAIMVPNSGQTKSGGCVVLPYSPSAYAIGTR